MLPALLVAKSRSDLGVLASMANRHGLIAGATGTGKTVTLQTLAERFSSIGVPVFMADVKGELMLVFFFDEAHLLFSDAPKELLERIEQVVRLVRSKGVGAFFVTQNPLDIPDKVLGQLGNRVQHALRAFTPRDQEAVKSAATTFRQNPGVDVEKAITELEVGEALVSFLDAKGSPTPVERAFVIPPASRLGAISAAERRAVIDASLVAGHYENALDRESAYERLNARAGAKTVGGLEAAAKSAARAMGSEVGRRIIRGVLGSILGGRR